MHICTQNVTLHKSPVQVHFLSLRDKKCTCTRDSFDFLIHLFLYSQCPIKQHGLLHDTAGVQSSFVFTTGNVPISAGLPLHVNELKDIEPQLSSLVALYNIDAVSILVASH